jgi:tetratricopeptide (TPR) repeat protein
VRGFSNRTAIGLKRYSFVIIPLIICYVSLIIPFAAYMRHKPLVEKLGYFPRVEVMQLVSADQKQLVGAALVMKVLMYYGGLVENNQAKLAVPPDYPAMSRIIHAAVKLDPYNMDAYYFAQSILVWDVRQLKIANDLLEYGMKYRTWDWYLPFFAGFNYAYFLKDYQHAAKYYMQAGKLTGQPLFVTLAGRYLHEAGETGLAISYLSTMAKGARNAAIKETYTVRLHALQAVRSIESARDAYRQTFGHLPASLEELMQEGYLKELPKDPYGGRFYMEPDGKVETTSKFAFGKKGE